MTSMRLPILFTLSLCCFIPAVSGQQVRGTVTDGDNSLAGAAVYWAETTVGVSADGDGKFTINRVKGHNRLVAAYAGYIPDTITVSNESSVYDFVLKTEDNRIDAVTVTGTQRGNYQSYGSIAKTELISFAGLTKMACCNLAESFENSASVTVGYSDAVSGAKQIRMLGLSGVYIQLLDESRPVFRGLGSLYGFNYVPGMWLQSIQVSKGTSSVVNGHEAISGQINLEYRKPADETPLFINGYVDDQLRTELNIASAHSISPKLSTIVLAHGSLDKLKTDHNHDGFLDLPTSRQFGLSNRWLYTADNGLQLRAGVSYLNDSRKGGQKNPVPDNSYRSRTDNENFNAYFKLAVPVGKSVYNDEKGEELRSNIALIADYSYWRQSFRSKAEAERETGYYYGDGFTTPNWYDSRSKDYRGIQNSAYATLMYNLNIDKRNRLIVGLSATRDSYDEILADTHLSFAKKDYNYYYNGDYNNYYFYYNEELIYDLGRIQTETGIFTEYTFNFKDRLNLVAGLRADHSNKCGWFWTPRAHVRWVVADGLTFRASAGKGYRISNPIADNSWILATGKLVSFDYKIDLLEESLTYGGSLTWNFRLGRDEGAALSFDVFRTVFDNQVTANQEYSRDVVLIYNPQGKPSTDTYQGDFNWTPFTGFDIFATFRYNKTKIKVSHSAYYPIIPPYGYNRFFADPQKDTPKPLTDKFKALINLQYATKFRRWVFDFTAQLNGQMRLPDIDGTLSEFEYSPVYPLFFAQVSRKFKKIDVYLGCENILDYTQSDPVISADRPYDTSFNSSVVWGPLMGRKIYAGFRFNL